MKGIIVGVPRNQAQCNCECKSWVDGCVENSEIIFSDKTKLPSIPYLSENDHHREYYSAEEPCHDCLCRPGKFHHPGCDMEICPRCKGQAISCWCLAQWPFYTTQNETHKLMEEGYRFVGADDVDAVAKLYPRVQDMFAAAGVTQADCVTSSVVCDDLGYEAEGKISFWTKLPESPKRD